MLSRLRALGARRTVHLWNETVPGSSGDPVDTLEGVAARWRRYRSVGVDARITEHDDMLAEGPDAKQAYHAIGASALRIVTEAMVLSGRTQFDAILDLPCGGGRVTRHLTAFFDDAQIHVGDIDAAKQAAVVDQFGASSPRSLAFAMPDRPPPRRTILQRVRCRGKAVR